MTNYDGFTISTCNMFFVFRAGKIPKNMLSAYQSACEKITTEQIEGTVFINTLLSINGSGGWGLMHHIVQNSWVTGKPVGIQLLPRWSGKESDWH